MIGKTVLSASMAVLLGIAALPVSARGQQAQAPDTAAAGPQRIELTVHGLSCPFCAYGLEKKLRKLDGVDSLSIDFRSGRVLLLVQDGSKATDERLQELVEDAGFELAKIERGPRTDPPSPDGPGR